MDNTLSRRVLAVTALVACAAIALSIFFQINKSGPFREINPFGADPYDAVGSIAFQFALMVVFLTFARTWRLRVEPSQVIKLRLVLHGNILVLAAILTTLIADSIAMLRNPLPISIWGNIIRGEFWSMVGLTCISLVALVAVFWHIPNPSPPETLTPADAIDDVWILVKLPVIFLSQVLPSSIVSWVVRFRCDPFFAPIPFLNPSAHPWRFVCVIGIIMGSGLAIAQLREGLPPNLQIGFLVAFIYVLVELSAILIGFAIFSRYLGLRPTYSIKKGSGRFS
jgi:hypothetical protein